MEVFKLVPANIYWKGRDGYYIGCNDQMADNLNLSSPEAIQGKTIYDLVPDKAAADEIHRIDKEIMISGEKRTFEEKGFDREGNPALFMTTKIPIFDDEAEVIGMLGVSIDITHQKECKKTSVKRELSDYRVLLVEDDPMAEKVARLNLQSVAHLDVANTGKDALSFIKDNQYDLVLMDVGLQDMDGYALTEQIRAQGFSDVTIIGLSAHIDAEHQARCQEAGMNAVYAKPLVPKMLKKILSEVP